MPKDSNDNAQKEESGKDEPAAPDRDAVFESGNVYFVYRPKVGQSIASSINDVQRFYLILVPADKHVFRSIVIGRKRLPAIDDHGAFWGFCETIGQWQDIEKMLQETSYETQTRGTRTVAGARAAAEGRYEIVSRGGKKTYLIYEIELPAELGDVQKQLNIRRKASYVINVKNPTASQPASAGLSFSQKASYPKMMMQKFDGLRFVPLEPSFLDYQGCEFVMVGARDEEG